jgi:hypothetical protein
MPVAYPEFYFKTVQIVPFQKVTAPETVIFLTVLCASLDKARAECAALRFCTSTDTEVSNFYSDDIEKSALILRALYSGCS